MVSWTISTTELTVPRLTAREVLTVADFVAIAAQMGARSRVARKSGFVAARQASTTERVLTRWNGEETTNTANPGDFIVANLSHTRSVLRDTDGAANIYVIAFAKFSGLYEAADGANDYGSIYRARGNVAALVLAGGFEIMAPWGEIQRAADGYLINNGGEIYGNAKATFEATYELL